MRSDPIGDLIRRPGGEDDAGLAFVDGEHRLTVFGEQHEVGFPVAGGLAIGDIGRPLGHGNTAFDEACGAAAAAAASALAARQQKAPGVILGPSDLGVNEAVDAFIADHRAAGIPRHPTGHLLGRPAAAEPFQDGAAQVGVVLEARPRPAPRLCPFLGGTWFVSELAAIALYLARDRRWRAIQSCRDLPERSPIGLKAGNLASVFQ